MKKFYVLFISGLIALCFSMSLQAQSSQQDLDQVELMKQFIGSWTAETGEGITILWEIIPLNKGYESTKYYKEKGVTNSMAKGIIGFTRTYQKVDWYSTSQDGLIWWEMGKFVSDKKITLDLSYASVPERRDGTWEVSFLTPDKMIWKWVGGEYTLTYVRIKEEVKDHETQSAPVALQKYDNIDEWIIALSKPDRDKWQKPEEVVMSLNLKPGDVVADIGAGRGYFTRYFTKAVSPGGKALGLDIDPWGVHFMMNDADMLESNIYEAHLVKPDNPELEPGSVDVVFMCITYHDMENRVDYLKRLSTSLKKNGRVVIVDWYNKPLGPPVPPVDHTLSKQVVLEEFREAGYNLTQDKDFLPHQYYLEFEL